MEKLIELLNEYHHFNSDLIGYHRDDEYKKVYFRTELPSEEKEKLGIDYIDSGWNEQRIENERIISKKFGFIKWLVENDKIDGKEFEKKLDDNEVIIEGDMNTRDLGIIAYKELLMLLSIQDEPIKFLISILK